MTADTPLGAVLAGGASRRMGRDKALVELDGVPLVVHVASRLKTITPHVVVVGRDAPIPGLATVPDHTTGRRGPVAGLETALRLAAGETVLLVATDQPFVRPQTLRAMLDLPGDAVVPRDDGVMQTICAVYRSPVLEVATRLLAEGRPSMQDVLARLDVTAVDESLWRSWGEDGRSWFSIDTESRLAQGIARYAVHDPVGDSPAPDPPS